jgi:hypothetical protein
MTFGPKFATGGPVLSVTHCPESERFPVEHFDEPVGNFTAAVETLIDNQPLFFELRGELPSEVVLAGYACVLDINVSDFFACRLVHLLPVGFYPGETPQSRFVRELSFSPEPLFGPLR